MEDKCACKGGGNPKHPVGDIRGAGHPGTVDICRRAGFQGPPLSESRGGPCLFRKKCVAKSLGLRCGREWKNAF
ncbi:hypothetical protein CEXT_219571 [Caerostris extrusa]|uniref:Uncharacterized protein n=1 Tax=Caerostris extrusa TaxID=172846 RepID=A0AAV4VHL7_CAEEX|nr:hypothetical protein CEXT_219571 [Caerostris extrusa]